MAEEEKKVSVTTDLDLEYLASALADQGYESGWETLIEFVKKLDQEVGDWDFTLALHKYFKKEKKTLEHWEKEQEKSRAARLANGLNRYSEVFNVRG